MICLHNNCLCLSHFDVSKLATHALLLPLPFFTAPNARASVILSSFYLSPSYNCLWQRPVSAYPASVSATAYRGRIWRRERWWRCLCFFTSYHCRSGTTVYFSLTFRLCPCSIPRTYFRPMGSSTPNNSFSSASPSTRYPRYLVPNTSKSTSEWQTSNISSFSLNRFTSKYRNVWSWLLSLEEIGNSCSL